MEALYTPLQMLEVTIRNRFHTVLTEAIHESWFDEPGFLVAPRQPEQLAKAIPPEEVIAELREKARQGKLEPAVWDRSMDRPLFEE